jgi:hypothetical protein
MKRFVFVLLLGVCLAAAVGAQNTPVTSKGSLGLQFSFAGFGGFGIGGVPAGTVPVDTTPAVPGYTSTPEVGVGVRYFLADRLALRGGLSVASATVTDTAGGVARDLELSFEPGITYYLVSSGSAAVYVGAFLSAGYASASVTTAPSATPDSFSGFGFGVGAILGAEYFILPRLSIGAEYDLGLSYLSGAWVFGVGGTASASELAIGTGSLPGSAAAFLTIYL